MKGNTNGSVPKGKPSLLRCAIYTRKSTEEGLQQEFNSLDAQRESGEAYIQSQQHEGWTCLPEHYDDGGYTGGNMDRPALQRLLADIEAGRIDCVLVYKVDRLSRSLLDFGRLMEVFDKHHIAFVSVTQAFNTSSSMGRLMLNVLLSFAQFEREIISERTRDKIAATRRKGKWSGGMPLLGYDVVETKLVVNPGEAQRVQAIFELYLQHGALLPVVEVLRQRGWTTKQWTTRKETSRGGRAFDKGNLYQLLRNVTYAGKVRYKHEFHPGEHTAIVPPDLFRQVQQLLERNGRNGGSAARNKSNALLKGLVRCTACDCAMSPSYTTKGTRRYRYYTCTHAQKHGRAHCPDPSIPAGDLERFVVERVRSIGRDPGVLAATLAQAHQQAAQRLAELAGEEQSVKRQLKRDNADIRDLSLATDQEPALARLADLQERVRLSERRLSEIREETTALQRDQIDEAEVAGALAAFDPVWDALSPREQGRILQLLIDRVDYDGAAGTVSITFQPNGIKTLAQGADEQENAA
jgi:site-specific DNA recombinase